MRSSKKIVLLLILPAMLLMASCRSKSNCNCPNFGHAHMAVKKHSA